MKTEMESNIQAFRFWLLPKPDAGRKLQLLIDSLADEYDGPRFKPHVTILSGSLAIDDRVEEVVERSIHSLEAIVLRSKELAFGNSFTKSCFISFEDDSLLSDLWKALAGNCSPLSSAAFVPHLSLFYGALNEKQRCQIRDSITVPGQISFSVLAAVARKGPTRSKADVESWQRVYYREL